VWAPNARRLAFVAEDQRGRVAGIATAGPGSSPPKLLVREKHAWCPVWSADGRRIVFFVGGRKALVADAATGKVRRPSAAERKHVELAPTSAQYWSTDGKLLDPEGDFDENEYVVRVLTLAGTSATFRWSDDHAPAWSPDGQHLAFVRLQKAEQIFVLDATTRRSRRLAAGTNPAWSPDGKWIAFERKTEVFVVPSGGGTAHAIGKGRNPTWSPNSLSVAATGGGLFVMSRDGKTRLRVDRPGSEICEGGGAAPPSGRPAWSHDGRMLAFGSWCEADQTDELAVAGSDGTFQRFIAPGNNPQWTADDSQIGFIDSTEHLAVIPAAGGAARVLDTRIVTSLALQPDGSTIAYSVDIPSEVGTEIWLVQTDGTNQRPLLQGGDDGDPAWRP
jgi:Tol biopolymer transport system component